MRQQNFFKILGVERIARYGGDARKGKRKVRRPFARNKPMHNVMKASAAKGQLSMLNPKHYNAVNALVRKTATKYGVVLMQYQNVGNHLHMLTRCSSEVSFKRFMKVLTGLLARLVTGARKGKPFGRKFWDATYFSRSTYGRQDLLHLQKYFALNSMEAASNVRHIARFLREAWAGSLVDWR